MSAEVLRSIGPPTREAIVDEPGVVAALSAGAELATSPIVAFCDDDSMPRPDWIARITAAFEDDRLGVVGGRDVLAPPHRPEPLVTDVGRVTRWGKVIGNHHKGGGVTREVDVLKAVNIAFRRNALALPLELRGAGAQIHFELAACLWAKQRGWRVVFAPDIVVDHIPDVRFDADRRGRPDPVAIRDAAFNLVVSLLTYRPRLWPSRAAYGLLVGDVGTPGLVRAAVAATRRDRETVRRLAPSVAGQIEGLARVLVKRDLAMWRPSLGSDV